MKIAFLCSSLEPGRDGVGDYCRRLGGALIELGHEILLIALNDRWIAQITEEQEPLLVHRLPATAPLDSKLKGARQVLRHFRPDWLSLQYVCYGYHPKGLPWRWNRVFRELAREAPQRHLMFHEFWIGQAENAPWREKLIGWLQRQIIARLIQIVSAKIITTSTSVYQWMAGLIGANAEILPLFGNIPFIASDVLPPSVSPLAAINADRSAYCLGVFFGAIYEKWNPEPLIGNLVRCCATEGKRLVLIVLGRSGGGRLRLEEIRLLYGTQLELCEFGEQSPETISALLQFSDFGFATTPQLLLGKSGSAQAMREHGLPVIATRNDWCPAGYQIAVPHDPQWIFDSNPNLPSFSRFPRREQAPQVTAKRFISLLQAA